MTDLQPAVVDDPFLCAAVESAIGPQHEQHDEPHGKRWSARSRWLMVAFSGFFAGALLITFAYDNATVNNGTLPYDLFWTGLIIGISPAVLLALSRHSSKPTKLTLLTGIASLTFLPKFLMSIHGPIYFDENAHFRELESTIRTGHLFQPNDLVPIAQHFPGLEAAGAALHSLSGLDAWQCALVTLLLAHCLAPLIVYLLAERFQVGTVGATLAALLYMANPNYVFFDTQYAYESLGIALVLITLLCQVSLFRAQDKRDTYGFTLLGCIAGAATVVTHHLSAIALVGFMLVIMICLWSRRNQGERPDARSTVETISAIHRGALFQFATTLGILVAWITLEAPSTYSYLAPFLRGGLTEVGAATGVTHSGSGSVRRTLLSGSSLPHYEILSIRAAPVVAAIICAVAGVFWLKRKRMPRTLLPVFVLALLYFLSLPLDLTVEGAPGAERSWTFSFIFLALAVGAGLHYLLTTAAHASAPVRNVVSVLTGLAVLTIFVGDMGANTNADQRFITPYVWGSDSREVTSETVQLADWFNKVHPDGATVLTDRYTGEYLYSRTRVREVSFESPLSPYYFYSDKPIPLSIWNDLVHQGCKFLIVDKRLSTHVGLLTAPFSPVLRHILPSAAGLTRFRSYSWTPLVYNSTDYSVYQIDAPALPSSTQP
jgi:hypothetical protein